jgi:hypothetical protein
MTESDPCAPVLREVRHLNRPAGYDPEGWRVVVDTLLSLHVRRLMTDLRQSVSVNQVIDCRMSVDERKGQPAPIYVDAAYFH